jgi:hypothetical protein
MFRKEVKAQKYHTKHRIHDCEIASWGNIKRTRGKISKRQMLPRTSVVLLLLVIVAELPLTLCCHPTLRLHHLFYFVGATLETLGCIVTGGVRVAELADRVVTLSHRSRHTGI